jgi:hypothetical protein
MDRKGKLIQTACQKGTSNRKKTNNHNRLIWLIPLRRQANRRDSDSTRANLRAISFTILLLRPMSSKFFCPSQSACEKTPANL